MNVVDWRGRLWKAWDNFGQVASTDGLKIGACAARRTCGLAGIKTQRGTESETGMAKGFKTCAAVAAVMAGSLALSGCAMFGEKECDKVITMNDLPAAVRQLAEKEVAGGKIIEVEKEMEDGSVVYSITYDDAGKKMEIEYSENGKLLSKGKE